MPDTTANNVLWRLEDLYAGPDDPALEADMAWCRAEAERFSADLRGKVAGLSAAGLISALRREEALIERAQRLASFADLFFSTRTLDAPASALHSRMMEFSSAISRDILFFELEWTQMEDGAASAVLSSPEAARFRHYLENLRRYRPHRLPEPEERLLAELDPVGASAWCTLFDKVIGGLKFGPKARTESEVLADLHNPSREVRKAAADELTDGLASHQHILTHVFNTILLDHSVFDRIRHYPHWLRARNLANEATDETVSALVAAVTSRYDLVHRYYRVKRSLLGLPELFDYDRYAPLPGLPERAFTWDEARSLVLSGYARFSPEMARIATEFFENSWIHAPVMAGKRGGAFAHPVVPSAHPYILVNFTGTHRDVSTLAHELGHGVHQYLARAQGLMNSDTPLTTAETASVFGEMLVFRGMLETLTSPRERLALLCQKIEDTFATVFRQVAMNRFEEAVHTERREKGELSPERIADLWMETQEPMFADSVTLLPHYRAWWSYIPHFLHTPGYVYAYAFGELLVLALYREAEKEGYAAFAPRYLDLLRSGGKDSPEALLAPFGIALSDPAFWHQGLETLESLLSQAEALAAGESPTPKRVT